jgi:enoyl-[acyl-carrier-protein] reductase (NADH)
MEAEVNARGYECDVAKKGNVKDIMRRIEQEMGLVDTLVTATGKHLTEFSSQFV